MYTPTLTSILEDLLGYNPSDPHTAEPAEPVAQDYLGELLTRQVITRDPTHLAEALTTLSDVPARLHSLLEAELASLIVYLAENELPQAGHGELAADLAYAYGPSGLSPTAWLEAWDWIIDLALLHSICETGRLDLPGDHVLREEHLLLCAAVVSLQVLPDPIPALGRYRRSGFLLY